MKIVEYPENSAPIYIIFYILFVSFHMVSCAATTSRVPRTWIQYTVHSIGRIILVVQWGKIVIHVKYYLGAFGQY